MDKILPEALITGISPYLTELKNFQFSVFNPLLWVFFLILVLFLSGRWGYKKAFSYCLVVVVILLANTLFEKFLENRFEISESVLTKAMAMLFVALVSIYYFFVRND